MLPWNIMIMIDFAYDDDLMGRLAEPACLWDFPGAQNREGTERKWTNHVNNVGLSLCFEQMMKQPYQELESTIFCLALFGLRLRPPHMPLPDVMTSTQGRIYDDKGTPLQKNFLVPNSQAPKLKIILGWLKAQYLLPSEVITFKHGGKLHLSFKMLLKM